MKLPSYFRKARELSLESNFKIQIGASILVKSKVVSSGCNQRFKSSSLTRKYHNSQMIHAEVAAIIKLKNKDLLKGSTIVVYRQLKNPKGKIALAKPCETCLKILKDYGVKKMIYTTENGYVKEIIK